MESKIKCVAVTAHTFFIAVAYSYMRKLMIVSGVMTIMSGLRASALILIVGSVAYVRIK